MELIQKIKDAEKQADQIIEDAKKQAADLLEQSKKDMNQQMQEAGRRRSRMVEQAVTEAQASGSEEAQKLLDEGRGRIQAMQTQARDKMEPAIRKVISRLGQE